MNIFSLHQNVVQDYQDYIKSFISIADKRISETVSESLDGGKLWPEPLLHFNPSFQEAGNIDKLVKDSKGFHSGLAQAFKGYTIFQHQLKAMQLGVDEKDFIVTSGTGSGKSLTYIGTICNHIFQHPEQQGVTSVIVYPMNALINSQTQELTRYRDNYKTATGKEFPIRFGQYTGQEDETTREQLRTNPPHILLTNYMMLELILTRAKQGEMDLRQAIYKNLRFLVFDEMHTYRGRQGADVGMLIRRLRTRCENDPLCMGTSATMVSGGTLAEQDTQVAAVAQQLFGKPFHPSQVIRETLVRALPALNSSWQEALSTAIQKPIDPTSGEEDLKSHPTAIWLEHVIALAEKEGELVRNQPMTLSEIVDQLREASGQEEMDCRAHLNNLLAWINNLNQILLDQGKRYTFLPFKLHQFFSQSGSVFTTLEPADKRKISLDPAPYLVTGGVRKPLYPTVFSRNSGVEFLCVQLDPGENTLIPRPFRDSVEENDDGIEGGYLILDLEAWNPSTDLELLPESWVSRRKDGSLHPVKRYAERLPRKLYFDAEGHCSFDTPLEYEGWYMPTPLTFDPTCGLLYSGKTNENTKLASLGAEGRSTSTTVTTFSTLANLAKEGLPEPEQKLLSFTDNRQDAALQAGHFNDFVNVVRLRAAIHQALQQAPGNHLTFSTLGESVFQAMNLSPSLYTNADLSQAFPHVRGRYETAFKTLLVYLCLHDLRRSWRVILPNLEQTALLAVAYEGVEETISFDAGWTELPDFVALSLDDRRHLVETVLDFFRMEMALTSETFLSDRSREEHYHEIKDKLRAPWCFESRKDIPEPSYVRLETLAPFSKVETASVGDNSGMERFVRTFFKEKTGVSMKRTDYMEFMPIFLEILTRADFLTQKEGRNKDHKPTPLYRLHLNRIIWKLGDGLQVRRDFIKQRSYRAIELKPNPFFQKIYTRDYSRQKPMLGEDHTGQLRNEDRIDRESKFKDGEISALFCSPTMELGVDISQLSVVHMRNVPPSPANYAQRGGRAGRSGQAALVFTFCSAYSSHDRHFFENRKDLVAGNVSAPRLDLQNEELILSHLHAFFLGVKGLHQLDTTMEDVLETANPAFPLKPGVLSMAQVDHALRDRLYAEFSVVLDTVFTGSRPAWYAEDWIRQSLDAIPKCLDETCKRWRALYRAAKNLLDTAGDVIKSGIYTQGSPELRQAKSDAHHGQRQIDLLRNDTREGGKKELTEFYPYRYLASEGFLPGYNFYRLPVRNYVQTDDSAGEYISRPRPIALREFGPGNLLYHKGRKYQVQEMVVPDAQNALNRAKISTGCGYFLSGDQVHQDTCPFSGADLSENDNREDLHDLLELAETRSSPRDRITCEEEERTSRGYQIDTYFRIPGDDPQRQMLAQLTFDGEPLLKLHHIPSTSIVHVNRKWRVKRSAGFPFGLTSGRWLADHDLKERKDDAEAYRIVTLYTAETADSLYVEPMKALGLDPAGVITLQYALKKGIEEVFRMEPRELSVESMGRTTEPNILLYESSEGSLGILSQLVLDPDKFGQVIQEAWKACRYDDPDYDPEIGATYDDLLDYFNQRHHSTLSRESIRDALTQLQHCAVESLGQGVFKSYEEQYQWLLRHMDPSSSTERVFLDHLHANNLRLPDEAQKRVPNIYSQPDFFYKPDLYVYCDGTPHDRTEVRESDLAKREAVRNAGWQVFEWHYSEKLADKIATRPDIFRKAR
jgi:superfamily II DNA or RNA helicase